jgi:hypothetical protein
MFLRLMGLVTLRGKQSMDAADDGILDSVVASEVLLYWANLAFCFSVPA